MTTFGWPGLRVAAAAALILLAATAAAAESITLAWDASPDPTARGYAVFIGLSPDHPVAVVDAGDARTFVLPDMAGPATVYFSVAAYNANRVVGPRSPEVSATIPATPGSASSALTTRETSSAATTALLDTIPGRACFSDGECYTRTTIVETSGAATSLVASPDGRLFFIEDASRVRALFPDGRSPDISLDAADSGSRLVALALDPAFVTNGLAFTAEVVPSTGGDAEVVIARYRVVANEFGERAVIAAGLPVATSPPVLAVDGRHLFMGLPSTSDMRPSPYEGTVLRLTTEGTVPHDNPWPSPVFAAGHQLPTALAADRQNGTLLAAGDDHTATREVLQVPSGDTPTSRPADASFVMIGRRGRVLRVHRAADGTYSVATLELGDQMVATGAAGWNGDIYVARRAATGGTAIEKLHAVSASDLGR